jgi:hypothetical protein
MLDLRHSAVTVKSSIFLDITPSQERNQQETRSKQSCACCLVHANFLLGFFFDPEDGIDIFLQKSRLTFIGLYGVIFQKMEIFNDENIYLSNKPLSQTINKYDHLHSYLVDMSFSFFKGPSLVVTGNKLITIYSLLQNFALLYSIPIIHKFMMYSLTHSSRWLSEFSVTCVLCTYVSCYILILVYHQIECLLINKLKSAFFSFNI